MWCVIQVFTCCDFHIKYEARFQHKIAKELGIARASVYRVLQ
ncbi:MAG TPA: hypothetical protein DCY55_01275 [Gammaproteobacteria bacterium]|nr:hypothetical protein [Gammaproteobacteria bacterium]